MLDGRCHDLKIGESVRIKRGFVTSISLVYAGMPSDGTFSLAVTTTAGNLGIGYNHYFPLDRRQFELAGVPVTVQSVSPPGGQTLVGALSHWR